MAHKGDAGYVPLVCLPTKVDPVQFFGSFPSNSAQATFATYFLPHPGDTPPQQQQRPTEKDEDTTTRDSNPAFFIAEETSKPEWQGPSLKEAILEIERWEEGIITGTPSSPFQQQVLRILPERVIRRIFVVFGLVLCIILMINGAGYLAFSGYSRDQAFFYCYTHATGVTQFRVETSNEASSLGYLAGGVGMATGMLFSLLFIFTLLVDALSKGRLQLCLALCIQLCCFCLTVLFLLSWAFLSRDIADLQVILQSYKENGGVHGPPPPPNHEEGFMPYCRVPASWTAASHLGLFGSAGWFGMALWILIWLITTRTAAAIAASRDKLIQRSLADHA